MRTRLPRVISAALTIAAVGFTTLGFAAPASAATNYPVNWNTLSAAAIGAADEAAPAGADNVFCRPSAAHPYPVILIHGVVANENITWEALAPTLANDGYCVYTLNYGQVWYSADLGGIADINSSASTLNSFVNLVRGYTGASKVDLVGHSEGGNLARLYMKTYGASHVSTYVGLAPMNVGPPTLSGLVTAIDEIPGGSAAFATGCPACGQLTTPSYYTSLNSPSATFSNVTYTDIATVDDEAVTPYQLAFLPAGPNVTNETVQSFCPSDPVGHLGLPYDKTAVQLTVNALDPAHAAPVPCSPGFPL
jgi:triacylglycerol lipase